MRKVTYGGACSGDAYITGPDEAIDWIRMSDDVNAIMAESWKGVDTILIGRKTYEFSLKPRRERKSHTFGRIRNRHIE